MQYRILLGEQSARRHFVIALVAALSVCDPVIHQARTYEEMDDVDKNSTNQTKKVLYLAENSIYQILRKY